MRQFAILIIAAMLLIGCDDPQANRFQLTHRGTLDVAPDAARGDTYPYAPTAEEVEQFDDLFRYSAAKADVLRVMGHPMKVDLSGGMEKWYYPWGTTCFIKFRGDTVQNAVLLGVR
ncbi:MAG: hypothetical protein ACYS8X_12020 [Planctomycetota bacterium]|jgi:hypothetical protein